WQYQHLRDGRVPADVPLTRSNQGEFRDLQGFVDGFLASYQLSLDPKGRVPGEPLSPPFGPSSLHRNYRFNDMAGFFQDAWKISPRLTLSPGLRYEYFGAGHRTGHERPLDASFYYGQGNSVYQRIANGRLLRTTEAPREYRNHYFLPRHHNFAPRLGLAYGVSASGKTVLRLGGGLFFERLPGFAFENANPPAFSVARLSAVSLTPELFIDPYSVFPQTTMPVPPSVVTHFDQDLKTAYVGQWNATLEQELVRGLVVSGAYLGSKGNKLYRLLNVNRIGSGAFDGRPGERLFNSASSFTTISNQASSSFHALQLKMESPGIRSVGLQFGANYTWSHSIDSASALLGDDVSASPFPLDAFNPDLDKGASDYDVRHRMVGYFVWQLPFGSTSRLSRWQLLSGWEITGIVSFQAGQPFNLRDSRVADRDLADNTRPRVTGPLPGALRGSNLLADARRPNAFLILPLNTVRRPDGSCLEGAAPFGCQVSVNGPFQGSLGRNVFRGPGTHFQNLAFL
ncbi:MAG TPA: TonB-dependent receptor, partial [Terriglobia bacterium]|nr:TonB-dependent receptor [Terriglobia bacterium]